MGINKEILIKAEWRFCFQYYASKMKSQHKHEKKNKKKTN